MYPPWNRFSPQSYSTNFSFSSFLLEGATWYLFHQKIAAGPWCTSARLAPGQRGRDRRALRSPPDTRRNPRRSWHGDRVQGGGCECGFGCWLWLCLQEGRNQRCFVDMWFESASNTMRYDYKSCKLQGLRSRGELFSRFDFQRDLLYVTNAVDQWIPHVSGGLLSWSIMKLLCSEKERLMACPTIQQLNSSNNQDTDFETWPPWEPRSCAVFRSCFRSLVSPKVMSHSTLGCKVSSML